MRAAAARLEPADAAASTRPSLLAVDRDGPATNELNDEQSESMRDESDSLHFVKHKAHGGNSG